MQTAKKKKKIETIFNKQLLEFIEQLINAFATLKENSDIISLQNSY